MTEPRCTLPTKPLVDLLRARKIVDASRGYMRGPYEHEVQAADRIVALEQALWDIYGILGFDRDGDATPSALASPDIIELVKGAAKQFREEHDRAMDEF